MKRWKFWAAAALIVVQPACDDSPSEPIVADNELVFTRENGTVVNFPANSQLFAWCGPWEDGYIDVPSVHVFLGNVSALAPYWRLAAVRSDANSGEDLIFPNDFVYDRPRYAQLFVLDPPNELSSAERESSGSIRFEEVDCSAGGTVRFTIDAVLGSEFSDGATLRVRGSFHASIGQPPVFSAGAAKAANLTLSGLSGVRRELRAERERTPLQAP